MLRDGSKFPFAKKGTRNHAASLSLVDPKYANPQQPFLLAKPATNRGRGSDNTRNKCSDSGARFKLEALDNDAGSVTSPRVSAVSGNATRGEKKASVAVVDAAWEFRLAGTCDRVVPDLPV